MENEYGVCVSVCFFYFVLANYRLVISIFLVLFFVFVVFTTCFGDLFPSRFFDTMAIYSHVFDFFGTF